MKSFLIALMSLLVFIATAPALSHAVNRMEPMIVNQFVGGTVERIDMVGLRLTVQTDLGQSEALPVASANIIKNLSKGDRISAELDDQGRVISIVKTTPESSIPKPKG
jgi:hypothetical protein